MSRFFQANAVKTSIVLTAMLSLLAVPGCSNGNSQPEPAEEPTPSPSETNGEDSNEEDEEIEPGAIHIDGEPVVVDTFIVEKSNDFYRLLWEADLEEFREQGNELGVDSNAELIEHFEEYFDDLLSYVDYDETKNEYEKMPYIENLFEVIDGFYYMRNNGINSLPVVFDIRFVDFSTDLLEDTDDENESVYADVYPLPALIRYLESIETEGIPMIEDDEIISHWGYVVDEHIEPLVWEYIDGQWLVSEIPDNNVEYYVTPPREDQEIKFDEDREDDEADCDVIHNGSGC